MARLPFVLVLIPLLLVACAGSGSAVTPTPTSPAAVQATRAPTATPLPAGTASVSDSVCPEGSPAEAQCKRMVVSCPSIEQAVAQLRIIPPGPDSTGRGTLVLTSSGDGTGLYRDATPGVGGMVDAQVKEGFTAVEVAWDAPGMWQDARARTLACRYATVARWVHTNIHQANPATLFIAQGTSNGSSQIAFGLAYYNLGEIFHLVLLGGGPPSCPFCDSIAAPSAEPLLSSTAKYHYARTMVKFFLGENEPEQQIKDDAQAYFDAITSSKTFQIVPGAGHFVERTPEGQAALVGSVHDAVAAALAALDCGC